MRIVKVLTVLAVLLAVATFAAAAGPSFVERRRRDVPLSDLFQVVRSVSHRPSNVQINYQSIGSGGGIRQLLDKTVDFGASDGPMNDDQLKQASVPILHFPTVLGADDSQLTIFPACSGDLNFTPEALVRNFPGQDHEVERSGHRLGESRREAAGR